MLIQTSKQTISRIVTFTQILRNPIDPLSCERLNTSRPILLSRYTRGLNPDMISFKCQTSNKDS